MEAIIFFILLILIYWLLDDVIGIFLYACLLVGVLINLTSFVTILAGMSLIYELIISSIILASMGKFYWIVKKKNKTSVFEG